MQSGIKAPCVISGDETRLHGYLKSHAHYSLWYFYIYLINSNDSFLFFFQVVLSTVLWTVITVGGHCTLLLRPLMNLTNAKKFVELLGRRYPLRQS